MNILIVGNGGREHALAWKAKHSPEVQRVFVAPGNAGTALEPGVENINISATDVPALVNFAKQNSIALTIVGPESSLAAGIVDEFTNHQLLCFGPTQAAARLEYSKAFSKEFMQIHGIPTARFAVFTNTSSAKKYLQQATFPIVIKADGLAAGKGVVIVNDLQEAYETIESLLSGEALGQAGKRLIIEEFLHGEEVSFIVLANHEFALPLATSQDYKKRDEGDLGPNTGGMGAYSPVTLVNATMQQRIMETVIYPTLKGMVKNGIPFTGFLYAGLMITPNNEIKVLEFNCRLGDPEAQPILLRLQSDLVKTCLALLQNRFKDIVLTWDPRPAIGIVMAAAGYPFQYPQGEIISGLPYSKNVDSKIFHSGTVLQNGKITTGGGRVLCATALGETFTEAKNKAYDLVENIRWDNLYYRKDIGHKAIVREQQNYGY